MEIESSAAPTAPVNNKAVSQSGKRRKIWIVGGVLLGLILLIVIVIVILAFTVFKAKRPVTTVNSVALKDLDFSLDIARLAVHLNLSLDVDISVKNPNKVGFTYDNSTTLLNYRGELVGEAPLPAGHISAGETSRMNISVTLMADRLLSRSQLFSDAMSGEIPMNTYTRIRGKVSILKIFKFHVVSTASCDLTLDVSKRAVGNQQCTYQTKL